MGEEAQTRAIGPQRGPQAALISCTANEILFGGARGGGKSAGVILDWIAHVNQHQGNARGLLCRATYPELEDILTKCQEFLPGFGFTYQAAHRVWVHPCGATLKLRYLATETDANHYQGHEYTWFSYDEVGNLKSAAAIDRLRATLRNPHGIRSRMVLTANPGGRGHDWIKARFQLGKTGVAPYTIQQGKNWTRVFIPSRFDDNLILAKSDPGYIERATADLPEYLRRAWRDGDWDITSEQGMFFSRADFAAGGFVEGPPKIEAFCRAWDRAATAPSDAYPDPDWTAGVLIGRGRDGRFYVLDVIRVRKRAAEVQDLILATAERDGRQCAIRLAQDPGQAGKGEADTMARLLAGYKIRIDRETGPKHIRWQPYSAAVQNGIVSLVRAPWNEDYMSELGMLTDHEGDYAHDDQADASAMAFAGVIHKQEIRISGTGKTESAEFPW